jgi:hypothetical protein
MFPMLCTQTSIAERWKEKKVWTLLVVIYLLLQNRTNVWSVPCKLQRIIFPSIYYMSELFTNENVTCISLSDIYFDSREQKTVFRNLFNTNICTILHFICTIFYIVPTCFSVMSRHLQGADTKVPIKLKTIE